MPKGALCPSKIDRSQVVFLGGSCISLEEIHKSLAEIHISLSHLCISLRKIHISSSDLCISPEQTSLPKAA